MKHTNPDISKLLNEIMDAELAEYPVPYKKGNSIRIKNVVMRRNGKGYHVFNLVDKSHVMFTASKTTALAVAHCTAHGLQHSVSDIKRLEAKLSKYYNDAIFYKYTVEHSKDEIRVDSAQMRFEIAMDECMRIRDQIENYLFDK
tara:strand:+ start:5307 stop:5738 length:432 start_codon:yes stop_codon:yes gene_type:complete